MNRFNTLLQREWMQHRLGWMILMGAPLALVLVAGMFTELGVSIEKDGETIIKHTPAAAFQVLACMGGMTAMTLGLAWVFALFQAPGLARRDHQDRSIEFWLSLPISHVSSLSATLLAHLLLVLWAALGVGVLGGWLVSLLVVSKSWGISAWFSVPWGSVIAASAAVGLRVAVGILLATLWLSPLVLMTMAASAWLKRWGVPLVASVLGLGGLVLDKVYGKPWIWDMLVRLFNEAATAVIVADGKTTPGGMAIHSDIDSLGFIQGLPAWAMHDLGTALQSLMSPAFAAALAVGVAGFGLLLLRRQRGA